MILLLTDQYDQHANVVINHLQNKQQKFFRLNLDTHSLQSTAISFYGQNWYIQSTEYHLNSEDIQCVWLRRPFVELTMEEQNDSNPSFKIWKGEWNKTLLGFYSSIRNLPWLNPLRAAYRAENKYLQMAEATKVGLRLPPTIVSNEKIKLLQFADEYRQVVLKLMTQEFYQCSDGKYRGIYVNLLTSDDLQAFGNLAENPVVLQAYIAKSFEVRYTVVGDVHHVCRIESQCSQIANIDWRRYDIPNTPHLAMKAPVDIQRKVTRLLDNLNLSFGALDFIVTPSGDWYFLEVNPIGQWLWIEDLTGLTISNSIANWLVQHTKEM